MKEVKFRAWHLEKRSWTPTNELVVMGNGELLHYAGGDDIGGFENDPVLMQFTGLKDKNGNEIYEGDIVRIGSKPPVEVRWHKESAGFLDIGVQFMSNTEVIGNIYENPELLSDAKETR